MTAPTFLRRALRLLAFALLGILSALPLTSCQTPASSIVGGAGQGAGTLAAGDTLKITFPGTPELSQTQKVRADGQISFPLLGDVDAAGKTLTALQAELARRYRPQLKDTEVFLSLQNSTLSVYVSGAVNRPGKVLLDRPMTALEAIMESGGLTALANLKKVVVIRNSDGEHFTQTLDLSPALKGQKTKSFPLKAYDIVHVPEHFF